MGGEMVWVTCERSYSNDMLPSSLSGEVILNKVKEVFWLFSWYRKKCWTISRLPSVSSFSLFVSYWFLQSLLLFWKSIGKRTMLRWNKCIYQIHTTSNRSNRQDNNKTWISAQVVKWFITGRFVIFLIGEDVLRRRKDNLWRKIDPQTLLTVLRNYRWIWRTYIYGPFLISCCRAYFLCSGWHTPIPIFPILKWFWIFNLRLSSPDIPTYPTTYPFCPFCKSFLWFYHIPYHYHKKKKYKKGA